MALFVDLVALSNGLHGSVQMDLVALFSWIGWLRHHGIFTVIQIVFKKVLDTKFSKYLRKEGQDIMYVHFRGVL